MVPPISYLNKKRLRKVFVLSLLLLLVVGFKNFFEPNLETNNEFTDYFHKHENELQSLTDFVLQKGATHINTRRRVVGDIRGTEPSGILEAFWCTAVMRHLDVEAFWVREGGSGPVVFLVTERALAVIDPWCWGYTYVPRKTRLEKSLSENAWEPPDGGLGATYKKLSSNWFTFELVY